MHTVEPLNKGHLGAQLLFFIPKVYSGGRFESATL